MKSWRAIESAVSYNPVRLDLFILTRLVLGAVVTRRTCNAKITSSILVVGNHWRITFFFFLLQYLLFPLVELSKGSDALPYAK